MGSNYKAPAAKATVANDTGVHKSVSAGLADGLSSKSAFDSEMGGPTYDYAVDGKTGNASERTQKNPASETASKNGKSFDIC